MNSLAPDVDLLARRRGFLLPSLVILGALLAAGCGGSSGSSPSPDKDLTAFAFRSASNPGLSADVTATITGAAITATVPFGTAVTGLKATFSTTGASVTVGATSQVSGASSNDYTGPVTFTVTAADASTRAYTVTVTAGPSPAKDLTAFTFLAASNPGLSADVTATIIGATISATVPYGTDLTGLKAAFSTTGASVTVGATSQASGVTGNDFTSPVNYTVTAEDASTRTYAVTVTVALSPAKDLTAFSFLSVNNPGLSTDVTATITGAAITATVPFGTDVTGLKATFSTTGASVAVGATSQASGVTGNDFTSPLSYTVTAADASTRTYTVTITVALSPAKDLTAFSFLSVNNSGLLADVNATISGAAISATVPYGTDVTGLKATFSTSGVGVAVGATSQASGVTGNDFTSPLSYTVTAADASTRTYAVTVTVALSPAKDLTAFSFLSVNNSGLSADVTATITGAAITATVPFGTGVTGLKATFSTTGASVAVGATPQVSGVSSNDYAVPVTFTVTAADASTRTYTVTIAVAPSPAKDITSYSFLSVNNSGLLADVTAIIAGASITATVPYGTAVTGLKATFSTTGASVAVGATPQVSGVTANNFIGPVNYTVTAADASTRPYTVAVSAAASALGDVAVNVGSTTLYKLNAVTGAVRWGPVARVNCGGLAVDPVDHGVYTGSTGNCGGGAGVYKFDTTGSQAWNDTGAMACGPVGFCSGYYVGNGGIAVDATSSSPGVVFTMAGCYGNIGKVSRTSGSRLWCVGTSDLGRPAIDPTSNGTSYVTTSAGAGYNYNTLYSHTASGGQATAASCEGLTEVNPADGALYKGGGMAANGCTTFLYQMSKVSLGASNWSMNLAASVSSFDSLAVQPWAGGLVYVGSAASSKIVVVDPASRTVVRTFTTATPPSYLAVNPVGGNVSVASASSHFVYTYSPAGALLWTSPDLGGGVSNLASVRGTVGGP